MSEGPVRADGERPRAVVSWSSGKDSAFALWEARRRGDLEIVGLLSTVTETYGRVSMHGVREEILAAQAGAAGLPLSVVRIPSPCPNEVYEARMGEAVRRLARDGVSRIVFGDLFLEDIRRYREERLAGTGITPVFPLWGRSTPALARTMVDAGLVAHLVTVDPRRLAPEFAGRRFDHALLAALPPSVDPCGERGEFHTLVSAGPMFRAPIPLEPGPVVERDGFVFADFRLGRPPPGPGI
ncbi:MAG: ATP-binding protein [Thermoplasmata archaeon]